VLERAAALLYVMSQSHAGRVKRVKRVESDLSLTMGMTLHAHAFTDGVRAEIAWAGSCNQPLGVTRLPWRKRRALRRGAVLFPCEGARYVFSNDASEGEQWFIAALS